ncbi:MAG: hypothetical protein OXI87_21915 [Albidovulum sp.]|nr:hypothetical protein [Albidovulum sp.]
MLFKREREACEAIFDEPGDYERQLEWFRRQVGEAGRDPFRAAGLRDRPAKNAAGKASRRAVESGLLLGPDVPVLAIAIGYPAAGAIAISKREPNRAKSGKRAASHRYFRIRNLYRPELNPALPQRTESNASQSNR